MLTTWSEDDDADGLSAGSDFEAGSRKAVLVSPPVGSSGCVLDACWSRSAVRKLMNLQAKLLLEASEVARHARSIRGGLAVAPLRALSQILTQTTAALSQR